MNKQVLQLVSVLLSKTDKGEISWQETASDNLFQLIFSGSIINISVDYDNENETFRYVLRIYDSKGRAISTVDDTDYQNYYLNNPVARAALSFANSDPTLNLEKLYNAARSNALGAEALIQNLINELESDSQGNKLKTDIMTFIAKIENVVSANARWDDNLITIYLPHNVDHLPSDTIKEIYNYFDSKNMGELKLAFGHKPPPSIYRNR